MITGAEPAHNQGMPFGMGFGELVLILVIVVVVFGATKLPQLGEGLGKSSQQRLERPHLLFRRTSPRRWTFSDWLLVGAAIVLGAAVVANGLMQAARGR
jgi:TatA/E family protein of Tat protein translocase